MKPCGKIKEEAQEKLRPIYDQPIYKRVGVRRTKKGGKTKGRLVKAWHVSGELRRAIGIELSWEPGSWKDTYTPIKGRDKGKTYSPKVKRPSSTIWGIVYNPVPYARLRHYVNRAHPTTVGYFSIPFFKQRKEFRKRMQKAFESMK